LIAAGINPTSVGMNRRTLLATAVAFVTAPAIVRASSLMLVKVVPVERPTQIVWLPAGRSDHDFLSRLPGYAVGPDGPYIRIPVPFDKSAQDELRAISQRIRKELGQPLWVD
jgi:hypothetical protein